jgi:hypothetical protein
MNVRNLATAQGGRNAGGAVLASIRKTPLATLPRSAPKSGGSGAYTGSAIRFRIEFPDLMASCEEPHRMGVKRTATLNKTI